MPVRPTEVTFSVDTWARWKRDAVAAREGARRWALVAFTVITLGAAGAGFSVVEDEWRYSAVVYAPLAGLVAHPLVTRWQTRRSFRDTAAAMRRRLVPSLVPRASTDELAELAARNSVRIGSRFLQATDTGTAVIVSSRPAGSAGYGESMVGGEGGGSIDDGDAGGGFGGDGGGGFGGGGGGDGGGGG